MKLLRRLSRHTAVHSFQGSLKGYEVLRASETPVHILVVRIISTLKVRVQSVAQWKECERSDLSFTFDFCRMLERYRAAS